MFSNFQALQEWILEHISGFSVEAETSSVVDEERKYKRWGEWWRWGLVVCVVGCCGLMWGSGLILGHWVGRADQGMKSD